MRLKKNLIQSEHCLKMLASKLDSLCIFLDEIYNINLGGCCFISYCIADLLEKDKIKYVICIVDDYTEDYLYEFNHAVEHVFISIENTFNINFWNENYVTYPGSSKDLIDYYNRIGEWNSIYDCSKNIYIKKLITNFYYDFTEDFREE